jgi:hypothetical protein
MNKVYGTTNYSKFSILPMNREIKSAHVQTMADSIKKMGVIRPAVCVETDMVEGVKKRYIIDGQHMAKALESLSMKIPYILITVESEEDLVEQMGLLNSTSKSWVLGDYVNAYKTLKPSYKTLFKLRNLYNMEYGILAGLGSLDITYDTATGSTAIKDGSFKITNIKFEQQCKDLNQIFSEIKGINYWLKRKFFRAFVATEGGYNLPKIKVNIKKHKKQLEVMGVEDESLKFIRMKVFGLAK